MDCDELGRTFLFDLLVWMLLVSIYAVGIRGIRSIPLHDAC
jgi:hypothetical protein